MAVLSGWGFWVAWSWGGRWKHLFGGHYNELIFRKLACSRDFSGKNFNKNWGLVLESSKKMDNLDFSKFE